MPDPITTELTVGGLVVSSQLDRLWELVLLYEPDQIEVNRHFWIRKAFLVGGAFDTVEAYCREIQLPFDRWNEEVETGLGSITAYRPEDGDSLVSYLVDEYDVPIRTLETMENVSPRTSIGSLKGRTESLETPVVAVVSPLPPLQVDCRLKSTGAACDKDVEGEVT